MRFLDRPTRGEGRCTPFGGAQVDGVAVEHGHIKGAARVSIKRMGRVGRCGHLMRGLHGGGALAGVYSHRKLQNLWAISGW